MRKYQLPGYLTQEKYNIKAYNWKEKIAEDLPHAAF